MPRAAQPTIVFVHANGFPAGTYRLLFEAWRLAGWRVLAIHRLGHDPALPATSNWPHLRDELLRFIEAASGIGSGSNGRSGRAAGVQLVGHSLGGYVGLLAASRRPDLVRSLVLLDAPLVGGWRAASVRVLKATGLMGRYGPGRISQTRRDAWPSAAAAFAHFAAKPVFARWDQRVLHDYVECGTEPDPARPPDAGGARSGDGPAVRLAFRPEIETRIYNTLPHQLDTLLKRHPLRCGVSFIGGTRSNEIRRAGMGATRRLVQDHLEWIAGGHLFPMERPEETAAAVLRALGRPG